MGRISAKRSGPRCSETLACCDRNNTRSAAPPATCRQSMHIVKRARLQKLVSSTLPVCGGAGTQYSFCFLQLQYVQYPAIHRRTWPYCKISCNTRTLLQAANRPLPVRVSSPFVPVQSNVTKAVQISVDGIRIFCIFKCNATRFLRRAVSAGRRLDHSRRETALTSSNGSTFRPHCIGRV